MGSKSSPPPAPDYTAAANATASGNLDAARAATKANRVNQYTPYGSLTYSQSGSDPDAGWSQTLNLTPQGQALLDQQNKSSLGLSSLQDEAMARVADEQSRPFDYSSVQDTQDAAYAAQTDRLDPQWQQREQALRTQLANQGITPGSEAFNNEFRTFDQGRNDAYTNARITAINTAPQAYQLAAALRNQPLNELNALRTGSQVTTPTFQNTPQQATTQGPDLMGAQTNQYNAALGATNAKNANSSSTTSAALGAAALAASFF